MAVGDILSYNNSSVPAYDGVYKVASIGSTTVFGIVATWDITATGSINVGATLIATPLAAGQYDLTISIPGASGATNDDYDFITYLDDVEQPKSDVRRKIGTSSDIGSQGGSSFINIGANQRLSLAIVNLDTSGDFTPRNYNIKLVRV